MECSKLTGPLLDETKHVTAPATAASKDWVNFGIGEAGQLNVSNHDKKTAKEICVAVEQANSEARAEVAAQLKPWWKFWK